MVQQVVLHIQRLLIDYDGAWKDFLWKEIFCQRTNFHPKYLLRFVSTVHLLLLMKIELVIRNSFKIKRSKQKGVGISD